MTITSRAGVAAVMILTLGIATGPLREQPSTDHRIRLRSRIFTPTPGLDRPLSTRLAVPSVARTHVVIQFHPMRPAARRTALAQQYGLRLLDPLGGRTFFASVRISLPVTQQLLADSSAAVRWIGDIRIEDKIAPWLLSNGVPTHAIDS